MLYSQLAAAPPFSSSAFSSWNQLRLVQELSLKLQACPFTMLRPDLPGVLLGALVNLRVLDLDLASFAPPVAQPAEGAHLPTCCD
jgi:hypothetical protein